MAYNAQRKVGRHGGRRSPSCLAASAQSFAFEESLGRNRLSREILEVPACIPDQRLDGRHDVFRPDAIEWNGKLNVEQRVFHVAPG